MRHATLAKLVTELNGLDKHWRFRLVRNNPIRWRVVMVGNLGGERLFRRTVPHPYSVLRKWLGERIEAWRSKDV